MTQSPFLLKFIIVFHFSCLSHQFASKIINFRGSTTISVGSTHNFCWWNHHVSWFNYIFSPWNHHFYWWNHHFSPLLSPPLSPRLNAEPNRNRAASGALHGLFGLTAPGVDLGDQETMRSWMIQWDNISLWYMVINIIWLTIWLWITLLYGLIYIYIYNIVYIYIQYTI